MMKHTSDSKKVKWKPYWSKQHGAYITLITSWIVAVIAGNRFTWLQAIILIFILCGLNFSELIAEKFKRATPLPGYKSLWLRIYAVLIIVSGVVIIFYHPNILYYLPVFGAGLVLFTILSYRRMQKSIISEWIIFAMFAIAGLVAYLPAITADKKIMLELWSLMSVYFGVTIFTVKARLKKTGVYAALIYAVLSSILLISLFGTGSIVILTSTLTILKSLQVIIFRSAYARLQLKTIGIIESLFHIVFISFFIVSVI